MSNPDVSDRLSQSAALVRPRGASRVAELEVMRKLRVEGVACRSTWQLLDGAFPDLPWVRAVAAKYGYDLPPLVDERAEEARRNKRSVEPNVESVFVTVSMTVTVWRCRRCGWDSGGQSVSHCAICGSGLGDQRAATRQVRRRVDGKARRCAGPGCDQMVDGRGDRRFHSEACAQKARRERKKASRSRSAETAVDPTNLVASTQVDDGVREAIIADTADNSGRRCANCAKAYVAKRSDARVCSDSCRKAIARRARAIAAQAELFDLLGVPEVAP